MCEYEKNLVAWIDGELESDAALALQGHLPSCESCSAKAGQYREVSRAFAAYHAAMPVQKSRPRLRWMAVSAAGLAAAAATILWMFRLPVEQLPLQPARVPEPPAIAFETSPPATVVHRQAALKRDQTTHAAWTAMEPFVEIAIPGDALFAPGAMPPGFSFAADLSIGSDGSPRVLRVQPGIYLK
jgi:anti-sigma factor RsiW